VCVELGSSRRKEKKKRRFFLAFLVVAIFGFDTERRREGQ
jgi:hypothetical protein